MSFEHILLERPEDSIVLLTINRPEKLNALNFSVMSQLEEAFTALKNDQTVRGLIVTGAGDKAFVAGADISELAASDALRARELSLRGQRVFRLLETLPFPSVAAINGYALGGGLELAMACTLRVAAAHARLGQPEVKLGIIAGYGGTQRLARLVGRGRALELLLTGEPIDAAEAHRIGLVNQVVPADQLLATARALLDKIRKNAPLAVTLTMEAVDVGMNCGLEQGLHFESTAFAITAASEDMREGTRAFLEKRTPQFRGR